ncbi:MAG TPA: FGGY-family carbohydrate kinase [Streptosporangiaceae bacterium]|nr:FGGY-family carbohydrate kinase [Streptosporangiaceae bacterium]
MTVHGSAASPPAPPGSLVLAIDLGTSALKVALVSLSGEIVAAEQETCQVRLLPGGGAEQDPKDWWALIAAASSRLVARAAVPAGSIAAVSCTAQWSGTVPTGQDGAPVRDAIIWMDSRGAPYARAVTGGPVRIQGYGVDKLARWIRTTAGLPSRSGKDSVAHILWLKHSEPDAYRRTTVFLEPKDWLNLRLTGRAAASFDSIALHWVTDNRRPDRIGYDQALIRLAGLDRDKLPELVNATDLLGPLLAEPAAALGVRPGIPVVAGAPDIQSAAIGSGATRDFQPHLYVGTSSWLTCHVPFKKTDLFRNIASLPAAIPGRYFVADEQETAGAALTFLRDRVLFADGGAPADAYRQFDAMADQSPPGSRGLIFTPWLYGERTPVEDHFVRGGFHNMSLDVGRGDLVRAVFEGVALNARWLLGAVEKFAGRRLDPIRFIGGGARSAVWCQIFADVLGRTIEQVADPVNANARGAAMIAAVALGELSFDDVPDRVKVEQAFSPDAGRAALYDGLFDEFIGLYKRNKKAYARLNSAHPAD